MSAPTVEEVRAVVATVPDPEIPVLTIADLGVLRDVRVGPDAHVEVDITPTYSGCPAMDAIRDDVHGRLRDAGWDDADVRLVLAPAWTTDDMSADGRRKLEAYGIAPPAPAGSPGPVPLGMPSLSVPEGLRCPRCGSTQTRELAHFGSTPCKALWSCRACGEPFDSFKVLR